VPVQTVQHLGRPHDVDVRVPCGFRQGLRGARFRGEMDNDVRCNLLQDLVPGGGLGHVAHDEFGRRVELSWPLAGRVDLWMEIINYNHAIEGLDQRIGDGAADETGTTCDKDGAAHWGRACGRSHFGPFMTGSYLPNEWRTSAFAAAEFLFRSALGRSEAA
jgi:hypothetical protein